MKIILLGYMGSGKSTIAKNLSKSLQIQTIDLDDYIIDKEGDSIQNIFKNKGEIYFRKKETTYLKELVLSDDSFILSLGGGTPCYGNNMEAMAGLPNTIYLKANLKTLFQRLKMEKEHRPLISDLSDDNLNEFIAKHLFERAPFYEKAKHQVSVDGKSTEEIVNKIERLI